MYYQATIGYSIVDDFIHISENVDDGGVMADVMMRMSVMRRPYLGGGVDHGQVVAIQQRAAERGQERHGQQGPVELLQRQTSGEMRRRTPVPAQGDANSTFYIIGRL